VWIVYLVAVILGGGALFVQLLAGTDHDVGGHDVSLDDAHPDAGPGLLSTRSVLFAVAAFGLVGAPLHILGILAPRSALIVALAAAVAAGAIAALAFRRLGSAAASGAASLQQLVGCSGRVLVPLGGQQRGKIRVALGGHVVDVLATTDENHIAIGKSVKVVDVRDDVAHVVPQGEV
jgi:membrane protein implicated in regulation of membrane protease activity